VAYQQPPQAPPAEPARVVRNDPPPAAYAPPQQPVQVNPYEYRKLGEEQPMNIPGDNLDLLMSVPIQITVELGRTRKKIKDIAELTLGNIVELDRQAGDQVDVIANGRLIARGDVVVVDDNYSVKITEIIKVRDNSEQQK
jgi:flagellar motor switch protein FliN/FliY